MARVGQRSAVVIPAAVVGGGILWGIGWVVGNVLAIREGNILRDAQRAAQADTIVEMKPKLDAIPRIQADVEWIRASMTRAGYHPTAIGAAETASSPKPPSTTP